MLVYTLRRVLIALLVAVAVSFGTFFLFNAVTDPAQAIAGEDASPATVEQIRHQYGFDRPFIVQYGAWLDHSLHGDFGESYYWREPVLKLLRTHAPVTIKLALSALLVTILMAVPLGILAALNPNSWIDRFALGLAVSAQAIPNFWLGLMLIYLLAVKLPIFPVAGDSTWQHFVLPAFVLGMDSVPAVMRLMRTGLLDVMSADYIRTARAKGFRGAPLLLHHALRNALLPLVSVLAVQLGHKLGGSVIVETVFGINGLGRLAIESILGADIPTVEMLVLVLVLAFVVLVFVADLINAWLDPRLRLN